MGFDVHWEHETSGTRISAMHQHLRIRDAAQLVVVFVTVPVASVGWLCWLLAQFESWWFAIPALLLFPVFLICEYLNFDPGVAGWVGLIIVQLAYYYAVSALLLLVRRRVTGVACVTVGHCIRCGYNLGGLDHDCCPECGARGSKITSEEVEG